MSKSLTQMCAGVVAEKDKQITDLQSQLIEKDKEIEELEHFKVTIGTAENNQVDMSSTTYIDQSKTEFAIEQLEKVREFIFNNIYLTANGDEDRINKFFDQQINELKGKAEDVKQ